MANNVKMLKQFNAMKNEFRRQDIYYIFMKREAINTHAYF